MQVRETRHDECAGARQGGFTLVEVMVASVIVLLLFFGLANVYTSSRRQLVHEEDLRNATAVAQARLESLRHEYRYEDLPGLSGSDTTYVVGGRDFVVTHAVAGESPEDRATTVTVTVAWTADYSGSTQSRSVDCTTILGRSLD